MAPQQASASALDSRFSGQPGFVPTPDFRGNRPGYVYRAGPSGVGGGVATVGLHNQPDLPGEESRVFLRDGSFESDVPVHQIGAHFGMSFAIVVQVDTAPSFTADALQHPG